MGDSQMTRETECEYCGKTFIRYVDEIPSLDAPPHDCSRHFQKTVLGLLRELVAKSEAEDDIEEALE